MSEFWKKYLLDNPVLLACSCNLYIVELVKKMESRLVTLDNVRGLWIALDSPRSRFRISADFKCGFSLSVR